MTIAALAVLIGCAYLAYRISRAKQGNREREHERSPEVEEALERIRDGVRRPRFVVAVAAIVALALIGVLVRNPGRWALLLLALAVLGAGVGAYVIRERRRQRR